MENKTKLYVRASDDQEWTKLNDATVCISHGDEKGELGDCGEVEEKMDFTATMEITAKRVVRVLKRIEREGRLYYQQFVNLVKDESVYHKILRCVKYGDKVPRKYMRKYNLVVKNLKNMQRKQ
jgi:F0F1-type ATP synthase gamma subunit